MNNLSEILEHIERNGDLNTAAMAEAEARQNILAKPPGSLGTLESISIQLAGITGQVKNQVTKQAVAIMCADNGVVEEGVASAPQQVTWAQTINFTRRLTGVSAMTKYFDIDLLVVDVGVSMAIPAQLYSTEMVGEGTPDRVTEKIVNRRIADGTKNLAKEPAMSLEEAAKALMTGIESVKALKDCGYQLFGIGEMGIGNTTTSACVLSVLTGATAVEAVGRGGGLNDKGFNRKIQIVDQAVKGLDREDIINVLAKVGGFDLCAMVGAFLGAAYYRIPVVIDGYISAVAALAATRLAPKAINFMFGSHQSKEPGYLIAMEALGITPYFNLGMRLGEGSGCPISFKIIETACAAMNGMATFDEGSINADYLEEAKKGNFF